MPPEKVLTSVSAASTRSSRSRSSPARWRASAFGQSVEAADHLEVEPAGEEAVDGGFLRGDADAAAHLIGLVDDVEAGHRPRALGGDGEGGEDADRGGLAGAVVAEQAEHGAGRHVEVEIAEGPEVVVALAEPLGPDAVVRRDLRIVYQRVVHSTINVAVRCTNGNEEFRGHSEANQAGGRQAPEKAASKAEKLHAKAEKLQTTVDRISTKAQVQAESLERLAARLESVELWMRDEPGQRQARFTRSELAQTAIRIVDAEGLDALSMRRLAAELGAGTMTLYHYVRTKDELLTLVSDEVMAEVLLPEGYELPSDWREAIVVVASRSRDAMRRHPWVFDLSGDLGLGPNSVKHMDQTLQAVDGIEAPLATKLDVVVAIDGYVFGYCVQERSWTSGDQPHAASGYVDELVRTGEFPQLQRYLDELGLDGLWQAFEDNSADGGRFERNLRRFIRGIEMDLSG